MEYRNFVPRRADEIDAAVGEIFRVHGDLGKSPPEF